MKKIFDKVLLASCMLFSFICFAQNPKFDSLSPKEFEALLNDNPEVQLVDVRRPDEFEAGHIEKAILINVQEADFMIQANSVLEKSKPVAVYCRSGRRSKEAAELLIKEGYKVYDLDDGYLGWIDYINSKQ